MKLAIMQPYVFPYLGYYQLINLVNKFIIYDDVNYINKGWINRNNVLVNNKSFLFSIPLKDASQNRLICDIKLEDGTGWKKKLLRTLEQSYKKAPYFGEAFQLVNKVLDKDCMFIGDLAVESLVSVAEYLGMETQFAFSSSSYQNTHLKAQQRILDICQLERADHYINPIGGIEIYSPELFQDSGVKLNFLRSRSVEYKQFAEDFVPCLSIIDVLMFNHPDRIKEMLLEFELV